MILARFLWLLSGEDVNIIGYSTRETKIKFALIGFLVLTLFIICFVSCGLAITNLFQNSYIGIPIGFVFAWMITNIYLLLLYTLSKNSFPHSAKTKYAQNASILIRFAFIALIAIIVSKPVEAYIFSDYLDARVEQVKLKELSRNIQITKAFYGQQKNDLNDIINTVEPIHYFELQKLQKRIETIEERETTQIEEISALVAKTSYYIKSLKFLSLQNPICWLITLTTIILFLLPSILKSSVSEISQFNQKKREIEINLVQVEYNQFKKKYNRLFVLNFDSDFHFSEPFANPPFNTKRKVVERTIREENDLIGDLYNA